MIKHNSPHAVSRAYETSCGMMRPRARLEGTQLNLFSFRTPGRGIILPGLRSRYHIVRFRSGRLRDEPVFRTASFNDRCDWHRRAGCGSECFGGNGARAEGAQVHSAGGPAYSRSDHDHRVHHPQSRVHDLRHAVCHRCQVPGPAADGGQIRAQQGSTDLHLYAPRRTQVPRRPAGALGRLHRLDRTMGKARRAGPEDGGIDRSVDRRQRPDLHAQAQAARFL